MTSNGRHSKGNAPAAATVRARKAETPLQKDPDMNASTQPAMPQVDTLSFQETKFDVVSRCGQPWLKAADIARALGYAREDSVSRIYDRNADEFTEAMSQTVNLTVTGKINGLQNITVRIFSLRGAHLIAMFARTAAAKAFRKWVLDILDAITAPATKTTPDTRTPLRDAVSMLVGKRHLMYPEAYSIVHQRFGVEHIDQLTADQIPQAVEYVHRLALDGEWLPAQQSLDLQQRGYVVTDEEADWLRTMFKLQDMAMDVLGRLQEPLRLMHSPMLGRAYDSVAHIKLYQSKWSRLRSHCEAIKHAGELSPTCA